MSQQMYTDAEIMAMTVTQLKTALRPHGETGYGMIKAQLRTRLNDLAGPAAAQQQQQAAAAAAPAAAAQNNPQQQAAAGAAAASGGASGPGGATTQSNSQEYLDLMSVLQVCGATPQVAAKFAAIQTLTQISDLLTFTVTGMEDALTMYNSALRGTSDEPLRIFSQMVHQRLKALVHKIRIWKLAGRDVLASEFANVGHAVQAVNELQAFQQMEKNKDEPTEFPAEMKADMLETDAERAFTMVRSTLTQCSSAHGSGSTLEYLAREPTWKLKLNPSIAEQTTSHLQHSGMIYDSDNMRLYKMIEKLCISHLCYSTVKKYKNAQDGRGAYLALRNLYQGENHILSKLIVEKRKISEGPDGLKYTGEFLGILFTNYSSMLKAAFDFIAEHRENYSEQSRVERLLQGFSGDALERPSIAHGIRMVKEKPDHLTNFDLAAGYLATKIQEAYPVVARKQPSTRTVNETNQDSRGDGGAQDFRGGGGGHRGGEHRPHSGEGYERGGQRRGAWRIWGDPDGKFNGQTFHSKVNGQNTTDTDVFGMFPNDVFKGDLRNYVMNRRHVLRSQGQGKQSPQLSKVDKNDIKAIAMEIAKTMTSKRSGEDDSSPRDEKKQKSEQGNAWNMMGKGAER